jgi:hypothetical protein
MSSPAFAYTVVTEFDDAAVAAEFEAYLISEHLADVRAAGAIEASLIRVKGPTPKVEVRYLFADEAAFATYEITAAPQLRADAQARFPPSRGVRMARQLGTQLLRR